jgi:hypothetical protein
MRVTTTDLYPTLWRIAYILKLGQPVEPGLEIQGYLDQKDLVITPLIAKEAVTL